ncbi:hypothetical protein GTA08_BOTSDO07566 [Neofusicoccum parvum]|nr:hypothetical protein GTA08_BOTSDO07566 [Neofusicoccum parvum]
MSLLQQKKHSTTSNLTCASSFSSSAETLMSHDKPFDSIIIQALPLESRLEFVRRLWAPSTSSSSPGGSKKAAAAAAASARRSSLHGPHGELGYEPFFEYYLDQCTHALCDRGKHVSVRTHRDVLDIADLLKDGWTRDAVVRRLCSACQLSAAADDDDEDSASESSSCIAPDSPVPTLKHHVDEESIHGSIDFVAKLLTMTSFGGAGGGTGQWQRGRLAWERGSLREALGQYFDKTPTLTMKAVQLEKVFNARNLQRFTNMQIEWTDNLADHLRMCEYEKKIRLFHHVTFLENHQG